VSALGLVIHLDLDLRRSLFIIDRLLTRNTKTARKMRKQAIVIPTIAPVGSGRDCTVAALPFPLRSEALVDEAFGGSEFMADATGAGAVLPVGTVSEVDRTVSVVGSAVSGGGDVVTEVVEAVVTDDVLEGGTACVTVSVIGPVKLKSNSALAIGCPSRGRRFLWRARSAGKRLCIRAGGKERE